MKDQILEVLRDGCITAIVMYCRKEGYHER